MEIELKTALRTLPAKWTQLNQDFDSDGFWQIVHENELPVLLSFAKSPFEILLVTADVCSIDSLSEALCALERMYMWTGYGGVSLGSPPGTCMLTATLAIPLTEENLSDLAYTLDAIVAEVDKITTEISSVDTQSAFTESETAVWARV